MIQARDHSGLDQDGKWRQKEWPDSEHTLFEGRAASTRWSVREGANAQLRAWGIVKVVFISEISQVMGKAGSGGAEWELGI